MSTIVSQTSMFLWMKLPLNYLKCSNPNFPLFKNNCLALKGYLFSCNNKSKFFVSLSAPEENGDQTNSFFGPSKFSYEWRIEIMMYAYSPVGSSFIHFHSSRWKECRSTCIFYCINFIEFNFTAIWFVKLTRWSINLFVIEILELIGWSSF